MWLVDYILGRKEKKSTEQHIEQAENRIANIEHHAAQIEGKLDPLRIMIEQMQRQDFSISYTQHQRPK